LSKRGKERNTEEKGGEKEGSKVFTSKKKRERVAPWKGVVGGREGSPYPPTFVEKEGKGRRVPLHNYPFTTKKKRGDPRERGGVIFLLYAKGGGGGKGENIVMVR